jgi:hypothetical protein
LLFEENKATVQKVGLRRWPRWRHMLVKRKKGC